jgi:hypothetical protein
MLLTYLMLIVALCLSTVAAFYSIIGLTAIFASAVIPVIIMGSILEVAKLVITVWLHEFWQQVKWTMKAYLLPAVVVLMFITSMGIFGFLSKAHIEQVGQGQENAAQLQRITSELARQQDIVDRATARAKTLETTGTGADANVNSQIDSEQKRIDATLARVQPAIDEQNKIVDAQTKIYQDQIAKIDELAAQLQRFIDAREIEKAQALVGTAVDGSWGAGTAGAVRNWQATRSKERGDAVAKLEQANNNPTIRAARDEIARIRKTVETQISESNQLIDRLRKQLGQGDTASVENLVNEQQDRIKSSNIEIENLTKQRFDIEAEYRKLAVEVGPIKYIAALIYGKDTDSDSLEKAVSWLIIIIVSVFDPLAVMMLLAATQSMSWLRQRLPPPAEINPTTDTIDSSPAPEHSPATSQQTDSIKHLSSPEVQQSQPVIEEVAPIQEPAQYDADDEIDIDDSPAVKEAKRLWKADNPAATLKGQRNLLQQGLIDTLPWESYLPLVNIIPFGQVLPDNPIKGYQFLNTGFVPSRLFKYNGDKWIEVDKLVTDSYAYNSNYINYLMDKIAAGEYDTDLLTAVEQQQIELILTPKGQ